MMTALMMIMIPMEALPMNFFDKLLLALSLVMLLLGAWETLRPTRWR